MKGRGRKSPLCSPKESISPQGENANTLFSRGIYRLESTAEAIFKGKIRTRISLGVKGYTC
jgi:hypothetical protein